MATAEAIEKAKLKIESLKEIETLTKIRFVLKNCSEFGVVEKIEENVKKSQYKDVIYQAKNIR